MIIFTNWINICLQSILSRFWIYDSYLKRHEAIWKRRIEFWFEIFDWKSNNEYLETLFKYNHRNVGMSDVMDCFNDWTWHWIELTHFFSVLHLPLFIAYDCWLSPIINAKLTDKFSILRCLKLHVPKYLQHLITSSATIYFSQFFLFLVVDGIVDLPCIF